MLTLRHTFTHYVTTPQWVRLMPLHSSQLSHWIELRCKEFMNLSHSSLYFLFMTTTDSMRRAMHNRLNVKNGACIFPRREGPLGFVPDEKNDMRDCNERTKDTIFLGHPQPPVPLGPNHCAASPPIPPPICAVTMSPPIGHHSSSHHSMNVPTVAPGVLSKGPLFMYS